MLAVAARSPCCSRTPLRAGSRAGCSSPSAGGRAGAPLWRRVIYGEWLPNTYYAKYTGAVAGERHPLPAASFVIEYGIWVWLLFRGVWLLRRGPGAAAAAAREALVVAQRLLAAVGLLLAHWLYYTFVIGGDHFEYRVYSHLVVLLWMTAIWMLVRIRPDRRLRLRGARLSSCWRRSRFPGCTGLRTRRLWTRQGDLQAGAAARGRTSRPRSIAWSPSGMAGSAG